MQSNGEKEASGEPEFSVLVAEALPSFVESTDRTIAVLALADTVCCALAAERLADTRDVALTRVRRAIRAGQAGPATVWADGTRLAVDDAALRNAVAARMLDSNDTYVGRAITHPSDMIPALVALAEERSIGWDRLIEAIGVAYEVLCRFADFAEIVAHGFDPSSLSPLGAAAGASWLIGLSPEQTATALRIAGVDTGTMLAVRQGRLSDWKAIASGRGAVRGLFAVRMAEAGCLAPDRVFEGPNGVFARVTGQLQLPLDGESRLERLLFKLHPAQIFIQGLIGLAEQLAPRIGQRAIVGARIETFGMAVTMVGGHGAADGRPLNRDSADHSAPFCVAAVLKGGGLTHDSYERLLTDPAVLDLMNRVAVVEDPEATAEFPRLFKAKLVLEFDDGTSLNAAQERPARVDKAAIARKFDALWPAGRARDWPWRLGGSAPAFPVK